MSRLREEVLMCDEIRNKRADEEFNAIREKHGDAAAEGMKPMYESLRDAPTGESVEDWFDAVEPVSGWRPIHEAIISRKHLAVRWLIAQGADVNALTDYARCGFDVFTSSRCSPLLLATQARDHLILVELLKAGAEPNVQSGHQNQTAAHVAAAYGEWGMLDDLKKFKADLQLFDDNGISPFDIESAHRSSTAKR